MIKSGILFITLALAAIPAASQVAPPSARQWSVNNSNAFTNRMSYAEPYSLKNQSRLIGYEVRKYGVNLGWDGLDGGRFEFRRQAPARVRDHRPGPIGGDEKVAIYSTKARQYLVYQDRGPVKAALGWSSEIFSSPSAYQWHIHDQSTSDGRVHFALFNDDVGKYLVYQVQTYGINLGWLDDTPPATQLFSVALTAQQIVQGWVPYLGSFGQNTRGNLLSVQNASQSATLLFVKPGKSTSDCSDPSATVRVSPRTTMTPDQMKSLYGSATPRLGINFLACLTTPTPQSISLTFINITYKLDP